MASIDLSRAQVTLPYTTFKEMEAAITLSDEQVKARVEEARGVIADFGEVARQLGIFLKFLREDVPREFEDAIDQFNAQSSVARILVMGDEVKIQLLIPKPSIAE